MVRNLLRSSAESLGTTMLRSRTALLAFVAAALCSWFPAAETTAFVLMDEPTLQHSSAAVIVGTVSAIQSGGEADGL
ncbi:MAG: hypothetical protein ABSA52_19955 [Candidatus Binatia bacterium]|jgi:hypothetical protein